MNSEFEKCLERQKIKKFSRGKALVQKELKTAEADLKHAKSSFSEKNYKWATIQSYYSMFHSARALLYNKNFRERSHYCLIIAVKSLYVEKKLLSAQLVEGLQKAKMLRENADYYDEWSEECAEDILKLAEEFLTKSKKIIIYHKESK